MLHLEGEQSFAQAPERLWANLTDLSLLVKSIPDVARIDEVQEESAALVLRPGFSFARGEMQLRIDKKEEKPLEAATLKMSTKGIGTSSEVVAAFQLKPRDEGTLVQWQIDIQQLGGLLKAVPQGLIQAAARKVIDDFLGQLTQACHTEA